MTPKKRIEQLAGLLRDRLPGSSVELDAPARASGSWFVNVTAADQSLVIEFRPKLGFGIFPEAEGVVERAVALVRSRERTEPQRIHLLPQFSDGAVEIALDEETGSVRSA